MITIIQLPVQVNKCVAGVACDMLVLLCEHLPVLLAEQPDLPRRVIETTANTVQYLLPATEHSNSEEDKRVRVGLLLHTIRGFMSL